MGGRDDTRRYRKRASIKDARSCVVILRVKGTVKLDGLASGLEYRGRLLNIEWRPEQGQLDIWSGRRVLSVERFRGKPQVIHYVPGPWELHLINAAKVAA
jgi:hypothetical protein